MHRAAPLVLSCAALLAAACGGDGGSRCPGEGQSLEILAPAQGAHVTSEDDVDPAMGGVQIEITVLACGFDPGSQVEVWETRSLMARYAVLDVLSREDVTQAIVPLVPVDYTLEARSVDGTVVSGAVSFTVSLD